LLLLGFLLLLLLPSGQVLSAPGRGATVLLHGEGVVVPAQSLPCNWQPHALHRAARWLICWQGDRPSTRNKRNRRC